MQYKINENITEILKTFSRDDIISFRKFLKSPFLNPYPNISKLFNALIELYPSFSEEAFNRVTLHKRMKSNREFNDSTMRDLLAKLKLMLEEYMAYSVFKNERYTKNSYIRRQLYSRKLYDQISKNLKETESMIPESEKTDGDFFYRAINFNNEKFNNYVINKKLLNKQVLNESIGLLNSSAKNHLALFILEMIKQNDNILKITKRQERTLNRNIIPELLKPINLKKIIITLKKNESNLSHIFQVYFNLYMLFSSLKGEKYFVPFKESILESSVKMNIDELHFLYGRLIDYCVNKCNEGRSDFYEELFKAYVILLNRKYYTNSTNKYISQDLFRNIFQTALRTGKLKWAEEFTNLYRKELHPNNRDSMYFYCYSYLYFVKKEYGRALEHILKIKQDYFALKIDIKILQLNIFYELEMYEQIYNQIDSFKHFISNHDLILPGKKNKLKDYILQFEKLVRAKIKKDNLSAGMLSKELERKKDKQFYNWLIQKAAQFSS